MLGSAQTINRLLIEIQASGGSTDRLRAIRNAYELAMRLFTGSFSGSGKTTLAHLVGTASILHQLEASTQVVVAGLLHAAYLTGDFGDGKAGAAVRRRARMQSVVGSEVEEYLFRFANLVWWPKRLSSISDSIDAMSPLDREVVLIRLADDLDRHRDLGALYLYRDSTEACDFVRSYGGIVVEMARKLGYSALAKAFEEEFKNTVEAILPAFLRDQKWEGQFPIVAPLSFRRRFLIIGRERATRRFGR